MKKEWIGVHFVGSVDVILACGDTEWRVEQNNLPACPQVRDPFRIRLPPWPASHVAQWRG